MWRTRKQTGQHTLIARLGLLGFVMVLSLTLLAGVFPAKPVSALGQDCYDMNVIKSSAALSACLNKNAAPFNSLSLDDQVKSFLYMQALAECIYELGNTPINQADAASGNITGHGNDTAHIGVSVTGAGGDGTYSCDNTGGWVDIARTQLWKDKGGNAWGQVDLLCDAGFTRSVPAPSATGSKACNGPGANGDFLPNPDHGVAAAQFRTAVRTRVYGNNPSGGLSGPQEYQLMLSSFNVACSPKNLGAVAGASTATQATPNLQKLKLVDNKGGIVETYYSADWGARPLINTEENANTQVSWSCSDLANLINKDSDAFSNYVTYFLGMSTQDQNKFGTASGLSGGIGGGGGATSTCGANATSDGVTTNCDDTTLTCNAGGFDWVVCPVIRIAQAAAQGIDNMLMSLMNTDAGAIFDTSKCAPTATNCTQASYYTAWSSFRILATAVIVIAGIVMVASQALGFEFLDAYTIRKVLPRLIIAVIGISLSWPLMHFVVVFFNTVGFDVRGLIYSPFSDIKHVIGAGAGIVSLVAPIGVLLAMGPVALTLILTAGLGLFVGFVVLIIRQIAIILLIILAPVAIACYILPNTQKVWKLWYDNFLGMMLAFPIISGFIAVGHVFALLAINSADNAGMNGLSSTIAQVIGMIAYFLPYFMIPVAIRLATGIIGNIAGFVNDRNKGAFDKLKKMRQKGSAERSARLNRRVTQARASAFRGVQARSSRSSSRLAKLGYRALASGVGGYNLEAMSSAQQAATSKEVNDQIATGVDSSVRGLTVNKKAIDAMGWDRAQAAGLAKFGADGRTRQYKSLGGGWVDEAAVNEGHARWGNDAYAQQAALSYEMRKAMTSEQVGDVSDRYASLAKDQWKMSDTQVGGAWIGAAFENQNQHLEFKNTDIKTGQRNSATGRGGAVLSGSKLLNEAYEKKGSYPLSQMSAHTIEQLSAAHTDARQRLAAATSAMAANPSDNAAVAARDQAQMEVNQARGIAETFMHEMGSGGSIQGMAGEGDHAVPLMDSPSGSGVRRAGGSGAASVNEAARRFAVSTGVYTSGPAAVSLAQDPRGHGGQYGTSQK